MPAVFLDRDGTIVEARHYPSRPEELVLCDGVGDALREVRRAGFKAVLVTNQSGIARGLFDEDALARMHEYLRSALARYDADLDAVYFCPHAPEGACDCRKPSPGMLLSAGRALDLDLARSWMVGDILDDIEAGRRAGCRTVLVDRGTESLPASPERTPDVIVSDVAAALRLVAAMELADARR
jgi:D-glycero-D-manno-heptose 1,7-bisphosphate phosphatase